MTDPLKHLGHRSILTDDQVREPRTILEAFFRRAVPDEVWRQQYLPLFE